MTSHPVWTHHFWTGSDVAQNHLNIFVLTSLPDSDRRWRISRIMPLPLVKFDLLTECDVLPVWRQIQLQLVFQNRKWRISKRKIRLPNYKWRIFDVTSHPVEILCFKTGSDVEEKVCYFSLEHIACIPESDISRRIAVWLTRSFQVTLKLKIKKINNSIKKILWCIKSSSLLDTARS